MFVSVELTLFARVAAAQVARDAAAVFRIVLSTLNHPVFSAVLFCCYFPSDRGCSVCCSRGG